MRGRIAGATAAWRGRWSSTRARRRAARCSAAMAARSRSPARRSRCDVGPGDGDRGDAHDDERDDDAPAPRRQLAPAACRQPQEGGQRVVALALTRRRPGCSLHPVPRIARGPPRDLLAEPGRREDDLCSGARIGNRSGRRPAGPADRDRPSRRRERAWVRAAQSGSHEAMEALFQAHWAPAHRAAFLIVHDAAAAEDIAQEAFLAAIRALDRFDRRRPFGPLAAPHRRQPGDRLVAGAGAAPGGGGAGRGRGAAAAAGRLVRRGGRRPRDARPRPARRRGAAPPARVHPGEIAQLLELPRGTVNSRLRRALDRLAAELGPPSGREPPGAASGGAACRSTFERRLRRELRRARPPRADDAERRAWHVVRAAHAARAPVRSRHRARRSRWRRGGGRGRRSRSAPPGRRWATGSATSSTRRPRPPRSSLTSLPAPGPACWWSPTAAPGSSTTTAAAPARRVRRRDLVARRPVRGGARGHELVAVDPLGRERWTRPAAGRVSVPRWSPDGYRVAYRSGSDLRVATGDNADDWLLARGAPDPAGLEAARGAGRAGAGVRSRRPRADRRGRHGRASSAGRRRGRRRARSGGRTAAAAW